MTKLYAVLLCLFALAIKAQAQSAPHSTQAYGKIDKADLEMKLCDFEPDANAEVLFDDGYVYFDSKFNIVLERHKRIKIFNDNGKKNADIRIEYDGGNSRDYMSAVEAQTINLNDGKVEITKVDKKLIYTLNIDKIRSAAVFTFPNVKAGSVIEYKYRLTTNFLNFPYWYFQSKIPVRYSQFSSEIPDMLYYKTQTRIGTAYVKHTTTTEGRSIGTGSDSSPYNVEKEVRALANIHSLPDEPFMNSDLDNLQCVIFDLTSIRPIGGFEHTFADTWAKIGVLLADYEDFGTQLKRKLANEELITNKAKALKTDAEKIAFVFNEVRNAMKWNDVDRWYTNDGTSKAWEKKTGNSAEVNIILYHLLKQSGVPAYPMVVSTRNHGKVNPFYPFIYQFNRAVVYVRIDSLTRYILDATGKYNMYNETPDNLLNSYGLCIDKEHNTYDMILLEKKAPVRSIVLINADIKADGKMSGTVQISSFSYNKINAIERYKRDGEKKYTDYLRGDENNLKISSLKFENMDDDALPLTQNVEFNLDLTGSDDHYIIFNPNQFTSLKSNPFLSENRFTDIDFAYRNNYTINGIYKVPAGYKIDALPKSASMVMPDQSISFKRLIAEQDGSIVVRFSIDYKKAIYSKESYPEFREFYKKLHEMLNEQIILKKS